MVALLALCRPAMRRHHPAARSVLRTDELCGACRERARDAQVGKGTDRTSEYLHIKSEGSPREARLKLLKREFVAQLLGKPGGFGEAVKEARSFWRVVDPPIERLPDPEDDVLVPPALSPPRDLLLTNSRRYVTSSDGGRTTCAMCYAAAAWRRTIWGNHHRTPALPPRLRGCCPGCGSPPLACCATCR